MITQLISLFSPVLVFSSPFAEQGLSTMDSKLRRNREFLPEFLDIVPLKYISMSVYFCFVLFHLSFAFCILYFIHNGGQALAKQGVGEAAG